MISINPFQVVCLREAERHLLLRCEELELHAGEQEVVLRELEVAMQRLALDADRRLTQQHRDHQNNIQLLLQKLKGEENKSAWRKPLKRGFFCPIPLHNISTEFVHEYCCFIYFCVPVCVPVCVPACVPVCVPVCVQRGVRETHSRLSKTDCSIWRKSCFSTKAPAGSLKRNSKSFSATPYTLSISPHTHRGTDKHTICRYTQAQTSPRCTLRRCRRENISQQRTQRYTLSKQTERHTTILI